MGVIIRHLSLRLRRLSRLDRDVVFDHLSQLDDDDRHARFSMTLAEDKIRNYVERIDFQTDLCFGVCTTSRQLVGFIHLSVHGHIGELGASVLPDWRSQGLARVLFARALRTAKMLGIREIHLATGHAAAFRICLDLGYRMTAGESYPRARVLLRSRLAERVAA